VSSLSGFALTAASKSALGAKWKIPKNETIFENTGNKYRTDLKNTDKNTEN